MPLSDQPDGKDHTCDQCCRTFETSAALALHVIKTHDSGRIEVLT